MIFEKQFNRKNSELSFIALYMYGDSTVMVMLFSMVEIPLIMLLEYFYVERQQNGDGLFRNVVVGLNSCLIKKGAARK